MIEFAAPWALLAAPVAALPVLLHLARRRRSRDLPWGLVRFLAVVAVEQRRRLALQERLLLTLRTALLVAAVLAAVRPAWVERAEAPQLVRSGRVACVLCVDDSAAAAVDGGDAAVRALALAWLGTLAPGDEVTVLPLSRLTEPATDPLVDLAAARSQLESLRATAIPGDHPALLLAGLDRLRSHLNPHAELVLVSAGREAAWHRSDPRWGELTRRLAAGGDPGTRARPRLVVLEPAAKPVSDLAVVALDAGGASLPPRAAMRVRTVVAHRGTGTARPVLLRISVDGRVVEERNLELPPGGETEVAVAVEPGEPGDRLIEARIIGTADAVPLTDTRAAVVTVEARLPIVLAEPAPGSGLDGALGPLAVALDPDDGADPLAPFEPRRVPAAWLMDPERAGPLLAQARALVLGGVDALDAGALAAIEGFVAGGGGLVIVPGDGVDPAHWARAWYRGGDGVLPVPPGPIRTCDPPQALALPAGSAHPLAAAFIGAGGETLGSVRVQRLLELPPPGAGAPPDVAAPLLTADGAPFVVERRRGAGRVVLFAASLDGGWTDLPWRPAFVPVVRSLLREVAARPTPPRTLAPGQRPAWGGSAAGARFTAPDGSRHETEAGSWEGRAALLGPPAREPGGWSLRGGDGAVLAQWACAVPPEATDPAPAAAGGAIDSLGVLRAADPAAAAALVSGAQRRGFELWPLLAGLALLALAAEAWLCGRAARIEAGGAP